MIDGPLQATMRDLLYGISGIDGVNYTWELYVVTSQLEWANLRPG